MKLGHFCQLKGFNKCSKPQRQQAFRSIARLLLSTTKAHHATKKLVSLYLLIFHFFFMFHFKNFKLQDYHKKILASNPALVYRVPLLFFMYNSVLQHLVTHKSFSWLIYSNIDRYSCNILKCIKLYDNIKISKTEYFRKTQVILKYSNLIYIIYLLYYIIFIFNYIEYFGKQITDEYQTSVLFSFGYNEIKNQKVTFFIFNYEFIRHNTDLYKF